MARLRLELSGEIPVSTGMFAPRLAGEITEWFKEACKANPKVPDPRKDNRWFFSNVVATTELIIFELHNQETKETAYLYVDRTSSPLGS